MRKAAFDNFDMLYLPVIAMLIFLTVFVGVIAYIYFRKGSKKLYEEDSKIPLTDDKIVGEFDER